MTTLTAAQAQAQAQTGSNVENKPEAKRSWSSVFVKSMQVRVVKVEAQTTSNGGVTFTKFLVAQNEEFGTQSNFFACVAFNQQDEKRQTNVSDVLSNKLTVGSIIELRDVRVEFKDYVDQNGETQVSNQVRINSNKQVQFIYLK